MNITQLIFSIFLGCTIAHLVLTCVMALFARHRVKYLAIAWIMGIFTFFYILTLPYAPGEEAHAGVMHPAMLAALMVIAFLQSVYPLSIPMPGYLQWGRMWRYASPAIAFLAFYGLAFLVGSKQVVIESWNDVRMNLLSGDLLMRFGMLITSFFYIANIFLLPRWLTHGEYPRYLYAYCFLLGLSAVFFLYIAIDYSPILIAVYSIILTLLNSYLCLRVLESMALELPHPVIIEVEEAPTDEQLRQSEDDFNEANLQRFQRMEYWMQKHPEQWTEPTFTRDILCRETGVNRHDMLQVVRSQGYNNVHDYINRYRIDELKRRISQGRITMLNDCLDVGFGTVKTVRSCFLHHEGDTLDHFMQRSSRKS